MKLLFSVLIRSFSSIILFIGLSILVSPISIAAQGESSWSKTEQTSVRLISSVSSISNNNIIKLGLQFKMKPGWKIYWRSPGDAGFPPSLNWKESNNLKQIIFSWPLPTRFSVAGIQTIGYKKEIVFPINAEIINQTQKLELRANLDYLACNQICIPYKAKLSLDIPPGPKVDFLEDNQRLIQEYTEKIPGDGTTNKLKIISVTTSDQFLQTRDNIRQGFITINATSGFPFINPDIFIEGPELIFFGTPRITLNNKKFAATFLIPVTEEENAKIIKSSIRLTLKDGGRSVESTLRVIQIRDSGRVRRQNFSFLLIIGFALLGGLILNLMPCVLPVISLKILSLVSNSGSSRGTVRLNFIATALGIVFSFLLLGIVLISLKLAGSTIGWGIQFQHPWFIVGITIIVVFFAFNLWGIFELRLPNWLSDLIVRFGNSDNNQLSFSNNFLTGAFATILATPCSAPFLGTAVGFALAGSIVDITIIFLALGAGMAVPYLIIAIFPGLANRLPKPGVWMVTIKRILSIALLATAIWLLSVLTTQMGMKITLIITALLILMALTLKIRTLQKENFRLPTVIIITGTIFGAFWIPYNVTPTNVIIKNKTYWQPFNPAAIPELVQQGKTILIDITAEWCITCKVNKATVLRRQEIMDLITSNQIVAMQGDWTKPNKIILSYLTKFNRFGIPFNAIYGPGNTAGEVLPELLTIGVVRSSLKKASKGKLIFEK